MFTINKPEIVQSNKEVRLQSVFELDGNTVVLWYEIENTYREYLTVRE